MLRPIHHNSSPRNFNQGIAEFLNLWRSMRRILNGISETLINLDTSQKNIRDAFVFFEEELIENKSTWRLDFSYPLLKIYQDEIFVKGKACKLGSTIILLKKELGSLS